MSEMISKELHEEFEKRMEEAHTNIYKKIGKLEKDVAQFNTLAIAVEKLAVSMESMAKEQERQGEKLDEIEAREADTWHSVKKYVITAIIGIIVGFFASYFGLS